MTQNESYDRKRWQELFLRWMPLCLFFYVIAAWLSPGYLHRDEHYQTIEFANLLLGGDAKSKLPWEYEAQIRPWLQPMLYAGIGKGLAFFGASPAVLALFFRLFSAVFGFLATAIFVSAYPRWFKNEFAVKVALITTVLLYWLPVLHARTSSESLSGSAVMAAVGLIALATPQTHEGGRPVLDLWAAFFLGLAFAFRYQTGLMALGILVWCLVLGRRPWVHWIKMLLVTALVVAAATYVDRLGYGEWVFAPWNYLKVNLIESKASHFGVRPFHAYIGLLWHDLAKPFGALVLLGWGLVVIRAPKHLLVFTALPFFVVHCLIPHKETRFLYPLLFLTPPVLVLAVSPWLNRLRASRAARFVTAGLLAINSWWLVFGHHGQLEGGSWINQATSACPDTLFIQGLDPLDVNLPFYWQQHPPRFTKKSPDTTDSFCQLRATKNPPPALSDNCTLLHRDPVVSRWLPDTWLERRAVARLFQIGSIRELWRCEPP